MPYEVIRIKEPTREEILAMFPGLGEHMPGKTVEEVWYEQHFSCPLRPLVKRLMNLVHVMFIRVADPAVESLAMILRRIIDSRKCFVTFNGETNLHLTLDMDKSRLEQADWEAGHGMVHIVGRLKLDFVNVVAVADIDLASGEGVGYLQLSELAAR